MADEVERPLSKGESEFLRKFLEVLPQAKAAVEAELGPWPSSKSWISRFSESDTITVTEVAFGWRGIGRGVPLATFWPAHRGMLLARLGLTDDGEASSLLMISGFSEPLAVRFEPFKRDRALRFMVGRPGNRSSVWRLWTGRTDDDIYLGDRQSIRFAKMSLHSSGDWRWQWTSPDRQEVMPGNPRDPSDQSRILGRWSAPGPNQVGWTHGVSIFVTAADVAAIPGDLQRDDGTVMIDPPASGWMVEFMLFLVDPDLGGMDMSWALEPRGATLQLVGGYQLKSGRSIVVWARTRPTTSALLQQLAKTRREGLARLSGTDWSLHPGNGPRTLVTSQMPDGAVGMWDLALSPPAPPQGSDAFVADPWKTGPWSDW